MCAYDEPFYRFSIPFPSLSTSVGELSDFLNGVENDGGGFDEPPFVSKGVYEIGRKCVEFFGSDVETVEMKTGFFRWVS